MKVLFISPYLVMKNIGASVGSWSHLNAIKKVLGKKNVIVAALDYEQKKDFQIDKDIYVIDSYRSKFEKYCNFFTLNGIAMNRRVREEVISIIRRETIDTVFIDESTLGKLARRIKKEFQNIRIISFCHDVKADLCRQWMKRGGVISIPYNLGLMYNEYINSKIVNEVAVLNKRDSKLYEHYYNKKPMYFLPHTVQEKKIDFNKYYKSDERLTLIFVGADYHPNVVGITWFIENVMPKVNENVVLKVVGKNMERYKTEFDRKNVYTIGTVDDLEKYYMESDVVISPIFEGGGMKTKTVEAFQYGKRIIATQESYEGYEENIPHDFWGKFCWKTNKVQDYIDIINSLSISKLNLFEEDIYNFFMEYYSSRACKRRIKDILNEN